MGTKVKKAFSFAHLLGRAGIGADGDPANNGQDQDDERKQGEDESDEDYAARMEELDKKDKDGQGNPGGDDEDPDADAAGETDKEKAARARERARCAAIFNSKAAGTRPDVAAHLAFNTSMSAHEAVSMLGAFAAGGAPAAAAAPNKSLSSRMAGVPAQNVGASVVEATPAGTPQGAAAMIVAAGKKRRGEA